jgi:hypothetical protein
MMVKIPSQADLVNQKLSCPDLFYYQVTITILYFIN